MNRKWRDIDGVEVLFGELAGYTVCAARSTFDLATVGLSFCNPTDRPLWNRDKGIDMALERSTDYETSLDFNLNYSIEDYVTSATYKTNYVPQAISDSVRENTKQLSKISDKKKNKVLIRMDKAKKNITQQILLKL